MLQVIEEGLGGRIERRRRPEGDDARRGPRRDPSRVLLLRRAAEGKEENESGEKRPAGPAS